MYVSTVYNALEVNFGRTSNETVPVVERERMSCVLQ